MNKSSCGCHGLTVSITNIFTKVPAQQFSAAQSEKKQMAEKTDTSKSE